LAESKGMIFASSSKSMSHSTRFWPINLPHKSWITPFLLLCLWLNTTLYANPNCPLFFEKQLTGREKAFYELVQEKISSILKPQLDSGYTLTYFHKLGVCSYTESIKYHIRYQWTNPNNPNEDDVILVEAVVHDKNHVFSPQDVRDPTKQDEYSYYKARNTCPSYVIRDFSMRKLQPPTHRWTNEDYKIPQEDSGWVVLYYPGDFALVRNTQQHLYWKLVNKKGEEIQKDLLIKHVHHSHFGLCLYLDSFAFFYHPATGSVISDTFEKIGSHGLHEQSSYAIVKKNNKYSLINTHLKPVLPFEYDNMLDRLDFRINYVIATNSKGSRLIDLKNPLQEHPYVEDIQLVRTVLYPLFLITEKGKYGLMDSTSSFIIKPQYDRIANITFNNLYAVYKKHKLAIFDLKKQQFTTRFQIDSLDIKQFPHNYPHHIKAMRKGKSGLIDENGHWVLKPKYDSITYNKNNDSFTLKRKRKDIEWKPQ
jgi:hypothetical protein